MAPHHLGVQRNTAATLRHAHPTHSSSTHLPSQPLQLSIFTTHLTALRSPFLVSPNFSLPHSLRTHSPTQRHPLSHYLAVEAAAMPWWGTRRGSGGGATCKLLLGWVLLHALCKARTYSALRCYTRQLGSSPREESVFAKANCWCIGRRVLVVLLILSASDADCATVLHWYDPRVRVPLALLFCVFRSLPFHTVTATPSTLLS
jgi:hypothetical protein